MTAAEQVLSGIEGMRAAVSNVAREWQPADLQRVEAARITLEASLPAGLHPGSPDTRIRSAAEALRNEISKLEFLVDAAAAFVRSAANMQGQSYTLAGTIHSEESAGMTAVYTG